MVVEVKNSSVENPAIMDEGTSLAPVIIEELDENAITSMDVDMAEFVEAEALEVREIKENDPSNEKYNNETDESQEDSALETVDEQIEPDDEDRLTKQFLDGELTFSEYSLRMDQGIETDISEQESARYGPKQRSSCKRDKTTCYKLRKLYSKLLKT